MHTSPVNESNSKKLLKNGVPTFGACPERSRREHRWPAFSRRRGQTLILFILFMFMLILFVGLGIDLGFAYITRARLSKAVDSACLMGIRNLSRGDDVAKDIARSAFSANYSASSQDATNIVTPTVTLGTLNNNVTIDVSATTRINTFFIRIMPALFPGGGSWQTLPVGSTAEATRPNLILSLVLDRSGSMAGNGGSDKLAGAVSDFIDRFDDNHDRVSMSSFAAGSTVDVTMRQPFKQDVKDAANALNFNNWTASERGLTNGLAEQQGVAVASGEKVVRVIVFFTDGMANTWYYTFAPPCGPRDIDPNGTLWDPVTENAENTGCSVPGNLPAIDPNTGGLTGNAVRSNNCDDMHNEAQRRAERIAWLARQGSLTGGQQITVYAVGMGSPGVQGECFGRFPVLNPAFLKNVANTLDSDLHVDGQPEGDYAIAADSDQLEAAFQDIADKIVSRLTK